MEENCKCNSWGDCHMTILWDSFDEENISDEELVRLVQSGDEKAAALLFSRMMPLVKRKAADYAFRSAVDMDDFVQEGFMGLLCAVNTYRQDGEASFRTYAGICVNNRIISVVKSSLRQKNFPLNNYVPYGEGEEFPIVQTVQNPEEHIIAQEEEARIYRIIDKCLSDFERRVFQLFLSGHSYDEIGTLTDSTAKSADNALQRVRRKLRTAINNENDHQK